MLKRLLTPAAGFAAAILFSAGIANAAPAGQLSGAKAPVERGANGLIVPVKGCHAKASRHMVHKWGKRAWHRHRPNCAPVRVKRANKGWGGKGCHRNFRKHFHPGWGGGWHRHVGPNCHPRRGKAYRGYRKGCFKVGPVYVCP